MKQLFTKYLQQRQNRINVFLTKIISKLALQEIPQNKKNRLFQALNYSILSGGKRLRPLLVYVAGETFGAKTKALDILAAAIEFLHISSLIHDDLPALDNDNYRRGKLTCHKKFNEATAVLAGDFCAVLPFKILTANNKMPSKMKAQIINILAESFLKMSEGQSLEVNLNSKNKLTIKELEKIYLLKTGVFIAASIKIGAIAAKVTNKKTLKKLEELGNILGLIFQIQDDIFDAKDPTETEKNKFTYPRLIGIEKSQQKIQELYANILKIFSILNLQNNLLTELTDYILQRKS